MDRQIVISDRPVHYTVDGNPADNPRGTVVLMHGWGCSTTTLASVEAVARQCGYATVSIDFPGHGQSPEPTSVWGVEEYTAVLEVIVAEERIDRPVLLGHSFGGRLGILYASRHPDGVSKLILVDTAGIKPRRSLRYYWKVYTFKAAKRLMYLAYGRENAEKRLDRIRARNGSSDYASASPRMRAILSRVVNQDLRHCMPLIKAPTLMIWGTDDRATPLSDARYMERHIKGSGLVAFEGCGHYSFLDNPVGFAAVLRSFLNS